MTVMEGVAAACGLLCVWLTVRQNIWCWPVGLVQVVLFIGVFYHARLYSDLILHVIYVVMQIYGWYYWLHGGREDAEPKITVLSKPAVSCWGMTTVGITAPWGYLMANYTDAAAPYADAFIAVASLIAQWLMARKKLESWYFWIAVDVVAIAVYVSKELFITSGLYCVFLVLATVGFIQWRASLRVPDLAVPTVAGGTT